MRSSTRSASAAGRSCPPARPGRSSTQAPGEDDGDNRRERARTAGAPQRGAGEQPQQEVGQVDQGPVRVCPGAIGRGDQPIDAAHHSASAASRRTAAQPWRSHCGQGIHPRRAATTAPAAPRRGRRRAGRACRSSSLRPRLPRRRRERRAHPASSRPTGRTPSASAGSPDGRAGPGYRAREVPQAPCSWRWTHPTTAAETWIGKIEPHAPGARATRCSLVAGDPVRARRFRLPGHSAGRCRGKRRVRRTLSVIGPTTASSTKRTRPSATRTRSPSFPRTCAHRAPPTTSAARSSRCSSERQRREHAGFGKLRAARRGSDLDKGFGWEEPTPKRATRRRPPLRPRTSPSAG